MLKTFKKSIALFVALVFVLSMVPFGVMAEVDTPVTTGRVALSNYAYSRSSATSGDAKNTAYKYQTYSTWQSLPIAGIYEAYTQLDLSGYEEILKNPSTTATMNIEAGLRYSSAKVYDFKGYVASDSADGYDYETLTYNIADDLGLRTTKEDALLFIKSDATVVAAGNVGSADVDMAVLNAALDEGVDNSLVSIHWVGFNGSSTFRANSTQSGLFISYDTSEIDNQAYVEGIVSALEWSDLSADSASEVKADLPTTYRGMDITYTSSNPNVISSNGVITPLPGQSADIELTVNFSYQGVVETVAAGSKSVTYNVTVAPEQALVAYVPFSNYAYSRPSASSPADPRNHTYKYETFSGFDCIQTGGSFEGYAQLDLKGYEEILNNPSTTATVGLEAGYQYSGARLNPVAGRIAADSADGYSWETVTWNIADALGMHKNTNPVLFQTTDTDLKPGVCTTTAADMQVLLAALNNGSNSVISLHIDQVSGDSKIRISSANSGLFISYYESEIDNDEFFADIESTFAWDAITSDAQEAVVNDLPNYFKGADIVWSSAEGYVTSSGELAIPSDSAMVEDTITANVSYNGNTFTKEFEVKLCDGSLTLGAPSLTLEGGVATGSVEVTNATGADVKYDLYIAVYSSDKELAELVPVTLTAAKGSKASETVTANVAEGSKVKFLVWEYGKTTPATVAEEK